MVHPPVHLHPRINWFFPQHWRTGLLKTLGALALLSQLTGCASLYILSEGEHAAMVAGEQAIVLLRVKCTVENQPYAPFSFTVPMDNVSFGTGTFETVGEPVVAGNRFLSEESRHMGWTYLLLPPGIYYLTVRPPQRGDWSTYEKMLQTGPRWRIDVPERAWLIYAGTLSFTGESDPLLFGGKILKSIKTDEVPIENEDELARKLLSGYFPDAVEMKTMIMQRWHPGDPIIIRSPRSKPIK